MANKTTTIFIMIVIGIIASIGTVFMGFYFLDSQEEINNNDTLTQLEEYKLSGNYIEKLPNNYLKKRDFCVGFCPDFPDSPRCLDDCRTKIESFQDDTYYLVDTMTVKSDEKYTCYCIFN